MLGEPAFLSYCELVFQLILGVMEAEVVGELIEP